MTQKKIVSKLKKFFGAKNVIVMNAAPGNQSGIPDVLVCIDGTAVFIEIKIYPDKLSKRQELFIERFEKSSVLLIYYPNQKQYEVYHGLINGFISNKLTQLKKELNGEKS